ncbi:MAG: hypothetical protein C4289_14095, partial [Chloroflexota bacterium]
LAGAWPQHPAAHPEGFLPINQRGSGRIRRMHDHHAIAVQASGGVLFQAQAAPLAFRAVPGLPRQRRVVGIDTDAFDTAV